MRIKTCLSPWINCDLVELLHRKNASWREARLSQSPTDWLTFRQLRNKCTQTIRKLKADYFKDQFSHSISDPNKFWKTVGVMEDRNSLSWFPMSLNSDGTIVSDKVLMADVFNRHFITFEFLFDPINPPEPPNSVSLSDAVSLHSASHLLYILSVFTLLLRMRCWMIS